MTSPYAQSAYRLGFDWGPTGALAVPGNLVAVVDVLSFTTTVTVAADEGIDVLPYRWRDESAVTFAEQQNAVLAAGRSQPGITLSPVTIRAAEGVERLVLPSPNGSTISQQLGDSGATVLAVSLRNRQAAADWVQAELANDPDRTVVAIAAGERWKDGSLRPAVEDMWGAGGFLAALSDRGVGPISPEARAAIAAYREVADELPRLLRDCASGRELTEYGFAQDVEIAAEVDRSTSVPVLRDGVFAVD
ncbi:2-phosphosulfolactate phosphatase [Kribbella amoyensis]|uniref:Probable 2-phosphosulfolactate phosphatase n=1 Tax=Kribbella amoyensis TaxID=996641 RepID=A0A561BMU1_9ACTN|nr:2-phosphosulfolactate phosphatase [Kribbella amoyensis]TWD80163.1 2-phosphosulfolactate phosphatase [Kribbella amoyensis]